MIQPGLERISLLLKNAQFPWKLIHVAGTNGKGSICATASALLTRRHIRNGRFISPHLINRWDCITINDEPISESLFRKAEDYFLHLNERENIKASPFELMAATAFQIFNDEKVDVGVVEVGMGGKLDATNILNNQTVSVISKIARDHQDFLGSTLEEIAMHKAGILRPNVPYIVNPYNEQNVQQVIENTAKEIGAGPHIAADTLELSETLFKLREWRDFAEGKSRFEKDNAVLGYLAFLEILKDMGLRTEKGPLFLKGIKKKKLQGRLQWRTVGPIKQKVLIDGAHNENAAAALKNYIFERYGNARGKMVWVLAMTKGKDYKSYLKALFRPGDTVVTTSFSPVDGMPWVKSMHPEELLRVAKEVCCNISGIACLKPGVHRALCAAKHLGGEYARIVVTGSLYLVGDFYREVKALKANASLIDIRLMNYEERLRVAEYLTQRLANLKPNIQASHQKESPIDPHNIESHGLVEKTKTKNEEFEVLEKQDHRSSQIHTKRGQSRNPDISQGNTILDEALRKVTPISSLSSATPLSPMRGSPFPKAKFFNEFESIKMQLAELNRNMPDKAARREAGTIRIRTHSARTRDDGVVGRRKSQDKDDTYTPRIPTEEERQLKPHIQRSLRIHYKHNPVPKRVIKIYSNSRPDWDIGRH
ncbi:Mur ligase [Lojkania enalia]|uniref:Mur ligase n=1 Tax=Lojkania enalia TaxID=147567 RepID=A0A9P4N9X2_9PLEO|nr:Mur ligase [Didymosphaeria enalia]